MIDPQVLTIAQRTYQAAEATWRDDARNQRTNITELQKENAGLSEYTIRCSYLREDDSKFLTVLDGPESWPVEVQPVVDSLISALRKERDALKECASGQDTGTVQFDPTRQAEAVKSALGLG